jgi:hypothetical protein
MAKILIWRASVMARRSRWIESSLVLPSSSSPEALVASILRIADRRYPLYRPMQVVRKPVVLAR